MIPLPRLFLSAFGVLFFGAPLMLSILPQKTIEACGVFTTKPGMDLCLVSSMWPLFLPLLLALLVSLMRGMRGCGRLISCARKEEPHVSQSS
jgi:hypothetical protein